MREQDDEEEAWRENPEGMQRKLLFHAANQSMKALSSMKIRPADAPESMFSQEQVLSSVSHNLLFGGRDILRSRQWSAFTPKLPPTPHSEPYEHPRARPATASSHAPWWIRGQSPVKLFSPCLSPAATTRVNASYCTHANLECAHDRCSPRDAFRGSSAC